MNPTLKLENKISKKIIKAPFVYPASVKMGDHKRIIVEVGPGRGDFLFHLAESNPDALVVGMEIKQKRVDKLIQRIEKRGLSNIMIIQDDARRALPHFCIDTIVDEIHINFPDPWPKRRHTKNRALSADFLKKCMHTLKSSGSIHFITDFKDYAEAVYKIASSMPNIEIEKIEADVFPTYFATKWQKMGRTFSYYKFRKSCSMGA